MRLAQAAAWKPCAPQQFFSTVQKYTKTNQRVHQDSKEGVGADLPGSRGSRRSDSW